MKRNYTAIVHVNNVRHVLRVSSNLILNADPGTNQFHSWKELWYSKGQFFLRHNANYVHQNDTSTVADEFHAITKEEAQKFFDEHIERADEQDLRDAKEAGLEVEGI